MELVFINLFRFRPSAGLFPIVVSQDCGHRPTSQALEEYGERITHIKVGGAYWDNAGVAMVMYFSIQILVI